MVAVERSEAIAYFEVKLFLTLVEQGPSFADQFSTAAVRG
jgi:hypothetical protein